MHFTPILGLLGLTFLAISSSAAPVDVAARRMSSHKYLDSRAPSSSSPDLVRRADPTPTTSTTVDGVAQPSASDKP
ncbi:hypothetical protein EIP91_003645, partial [Steccherinum ochraceum]